MFGSFVGLDGERESQEQQQRHWEQTSHPAETKTGRETQSGSSASKTRGDDGVGGRLPADYWAAAAGCVNTNTDTCTDVQSGGNALLQGLLSGLNGLKGGQGAQVTQIHKTARESSQRDTKHVYKLRKMVYKETRLEKSDPIRRRKRPQETETKRQLTPEKRFWRD